MPFSDSPKQDELADAQLARDLREHLAADQRDLEHGELSLVHGRIAVVEVGRHHGAQDRVAQELQALVGRRDGLALGGRGMRDGRYDEVLVGEVVADDLLYALDSLVQLQGAPFLQSGLDAVR